MDQHERDSEYKQELMEQLRINNRLLIIVANTAVAYLAHFTKNEYDLAALQETEVQIKNLEKRMDE